MACRASVSAAAACTSAVVRINGLHSSLPNVRTFPSNSPRTASLYQPPPAYKHRIHGVQKEATLDPKSSYKDDDLSSDNRKIKMLYDGECPLCMREVNMLKERNKQYRAIKFVDISSKDYSPEDNQGLEYKTVMGRIHAILSDGTVVTDIEAFRRLYEEVGLGWVYAVTKYKPIAIIADAIYSVWARYRLQITGQFSQHFITTLKWIQQTIDCAFHHAVDHLSFGIIGRPPLEDILATRSKNMVEECNDSKACKM